MKLIINKLILYYMHRYYNGYCTQKLRKGFKQSAYKNRNAKNTRERKNKANG